MWRFHTDNDITAYIVRLLDNSFVVGPVITWSYYSFCLYYHILEALTLRIVEV